MINRVAHKELAKGYLGQNGNQSGMAGAEILYKVLNTITGAALGVVFTALRVYSVIFYLLGALLGGVLVPLINVAIEIVHIMVKAAIIAPFVVGRGRYYLHLRKNGSRTSVTKLFEGYDYFLEFASVEARRQFSILWLPTAIEATASLVNGIILAVCGGFGILMSSIIEREIPELAGSVLVGMVVSLLISVVARITASIVKIYRTLQLWAVDWILADHPGMTADQVLHYSRQITQGHIWDLFIYELSFLGWRILNKLTCDVLGFVFVDPYYNMTSALLYEELKGGAIELDAIPGNSNLQDLSRRVKPVDDYTFAKRSQDAKPSQPSQPAKPSQPAQQEPALRGVAGMYAGSVFKLKPDQTVVLGRDPKQAQIVFSQGADRISRRHCSVMFSSRLGQYQVVDHSSNGTFVSGSRLQLNVPVTLPRGTQLALGSNDNIIRLE